MVKPMQRLTKYSLILRRIIAHTETEPERTSLIAMVSCTTAYYVRNEYQIIGKTGENPTTLAKDWMIEIKINRNKNLILQDHFKIAINLM